MPELAETLCMRDSLRKKLISEDYSTKIKYIQITEKSRYFKKGFPELYGPDWPQKNFIDDKTIRIEFNQKLKSIYNRGKKIIFELDNNWLVSSLGMEGHWVFNKGKHSDMSIKLSIRNKKTNTKEHIKIYFDDSRHFGILKICSDEEEYDNALKDVGPDYMTENIPFIDFDRQLTRYWNKEINWFLMNQKIFSGIGTIIKSETLDASNIDPRDTCGEISGDKRRILYNNIHRIINEIYECGGTTIATYIDPDGNIGRYKPKVYGRKTDDQGRKVERIYLSDKRVTYWIPEKFESNE